MNPPELQLTCIAILFVEDWFVIGVQWHPENDTASRLDMQIFEAFVQACEDRRQGVEFVLPFPTHKAA